MTPTERLRWLAGDCQATSAWAADLKAGADALDRLAQTCGTCQHADMYHADEGWYFCSGPVRSDPRKETHPFRYRSMPLDERCKGWTKREDAK